MALPHLIVIIVKVCIQSAIAGLLLALLLRLILGFNKKRFLVSWLSISIISFIGLFVYLNTHWGDHGIGDYKRIPLLHERSIQKINDINVQIEPDNYTHGSLMINHFVITDNAIVGSTATSTVDDPEPYFKWDLQLNEITFYKSDSVYNEVAINDGYPPIDTFKPFDSYYNNYWYGWRFWLLA